MAERIVVMGGSFNPPTIAHYHLMLQAIQALDAGFGIFVPVSQNYLRQKMRHSQAPLCLGEQLRLDMLLRMCAGDLKLDISDLEYRNPDWDTDQTMEALQDRYPEAKLYFLAGSDKLDVLENLAARGDFLNRYGVILACREDFVPETMGQNAVLAPYRHAFLFLESPEAAEQISATRVRKLFFAGEWEKIQLLLPEGVWELFSRLNPQDYRERPPSFPGTRN